MRNVFVLYMGTSSGSEFYFKNFTDLGALKHTINSDLREVMFFSTKKMAEKVRDYLNNSYLIKEVSVCRITPKNICPFEELNSYLEKKQRKTFFKICFWVNNPFK